MSPLVIPPLIKFGLGAVGAAAIVHWVAKEVRRINESLARAQAPAMDPVRRASLPTLRRDPGTGEWRVM